MSDNRIMYLKTLDRRLHAKIDAIRDHLTLNMIGVAVIGLIALSSLVWS